MFTRAKQQPAKPPVMRQPLLVVTRPTPPKPALILFADVGGFVLLKERGLDVARCQRCWLGFVIRDTNKARMIEMMHTHKEVSHHGTELRENVGSGSPT
jgi:hypothetical protein